MLNLGLANNLLKKVSKLTPHKINIMDTNGVIVGSTKKECRGIVHCIGLEILGSDQDEVIVTPGDNDNIRGIDAGVYVPLVVRGDKVGVLGISGPAEETQAVAHLVKLCIESLLELEIYKQQRSPNVLDGEQYIHRILYDSKISKETIQYIVQGTNIHPDTARIPILLVVHNAANEEKEHGENIIECICADESYSSNDLLGKTLDGNVIWFRCVPLTYIHKAMAFKAVLEADVQRIIVRLREEVWYSAYIGPIQGKMQNYRMAYMQCEWMRLNICTVGTYYFYEHILHYLLDKIAKVEAETIFSTICGSFDEGFVENYKEIVGALVQCDYSFSKTAEKLYVHKNTAVYRFDKIRNQLDMNPLVNNAEREFMECLYYFILENVRYQEEQT